MGSVLKTGFSPGKSLWCFAFVSKCTWPWHYRRCCCVIFFQIFTTYLWRQCTKMWKSAQLPHVKESEKKFLHQDFDPDFVHYRKTLRDLHFQLCVQIWKWSNWNCGLYRVHGQTDRQTNTRNEPTYLRFSQVIILGEITHPVGGHKVHKDNLRVNNSLYPLLMVWVTFKWRKKISIKIFDSRYLKKYWR